MSFTYEYARPAITVDCVVFGLDENDLKVLLIQRKLHPFQHGWALPGGFVRIDSAESKGTTVTMFLPTAGGRT